MNFVQRSLPRLTTPTSEPGWNWERVNAVLSKPTLVERCKLLFKSWKTVTAPKGTPCAIMNLHNEPLYRFKTLDNKTFYLGPEPSMGFPGS